MYNINAFENLLVDNKFVQLANFQYSTLSMSDNFQHSTLTTFKIQQLSTFNFDNLVSNMQFQFSVFRTCNLSKLRSWKLSALNFEDFHFRSLRFQLWDVNFEVWRFKFWRFSLSHFEVSHFRGFKFEDSSLKFEVSHFQVWSLRFQISHFQSYLRFLSLSLSRRRPSLRVAGQATAISPLAVAFIPADCAQQRR